MSYILSALKKVERDRQTGTAPSLLSVQIEEAPELAGSRWPQILMLAIGVIALLAVGIWHLPNWVVGTDWNQVLRSAGIERPTATRLSPVRPPAPAAPEPPAPTFGEAKDSNPTERPAATARDAMAEPYLSPPPSDRIPAFNEIAPEVRDQIPPFSVSGYLYSAQRPQASKAIVNGAALRAGQYVSDDLMIKEINADYIVMDFRGMPFRIEHGEFPKNRP